MAVIVLVTVDGHTGAQAVVPRGKVSVVPTPDTVMSYATYVIGTFRAEKGDSITGYTLTFDGDTDATGATPPSADDTLTVAPDGRTVTVTLGTPIVAPAQFTITIGNVRNPPTPAIMEIASVIFHTADGDRTVSLGGSGTYEILPAPYVSMTVTTPDDGQSVVFGSVDPGVTSPAKDVLLEVTSSRQYTITRVIGGDSTALGLQVSGVPVGVLQLAALTPASFVDTIALAPPWTTDPDIPLNAWIAYTVVMEP